MNVNRCYAIVYPMKAKSVCTVKKAKIVLAFVWAGSFLLAVPTIFIQVSAAAFLHFAPGARS